MWLMPRGANIRKRMIAKLGARRGPLFARRKRFLTPFILVFLTSAAQAQVAVRLAPEAASLFLYEPLPLRLELECDAPPETPELPAVPAWP